MRLTSEQVLGAYARGIFPMAASAESPSLHWFEPTWRGVLPLDRFHASRSLIRSLRRGDWRFSCDRDFAGVLAGCADREETWINAEIAQIFLELHAQGHAHSIEVRSEAGDLVGGVYGLALGAVFFAESMFSKRTDASKLALAELVARLRRGGFQLLDTQYLTEHLARMGGTEVPRSAYRVYLRQALSVEADPAAAFAPENPETASGAYWQPITQTS
ncbi:leucyl/phenylalanyl-tRNA--protein transferase [Pararhodobacter sp. SW119]|uniref:leucyl/phenylalanyl-tRNA--protein transferase n=1 Tax=Pararhodobacter sp. SW119 TaxID=2780075 RepID=UPI001ADF4AA0|nr:leucyl/phenylalanyl-tRNA--protein transferase [Pararhodobacter sp. SW119]